MVLRPAAAARHDRVELVAREEIRDHAELRARRPPQMPGVAAGSSVSLSADFNLDVHKDACDYSCF